MESYALFLELIDQKEKMQWISGEPIVGIDEYGRD